jgi:hypothetical protein
MRQWHEFKAQSPAMVNQIKPLNAPAPALPLLDSIRNHDEVRRIIQDL